ncbi:MAG: DUF1150 family protein [Rhizobiales bacterium]|nr:DUF1150 family protein [Hyphomicrobiales bacterium]
MQNEKNGHDSAATPVWGVLAERDISPENFAAIGMPNIVYVREVLMADIRDDLPEASDLPDDTKFYAVHAANGTRMAIVDDRNTAFAGARQYDLDPVSVH